jgi:hypothetical protein
MTRSRRASAKEYSPPAKRRSGPGCWAFLLKRGQAAEAFHTLERSRARNFLRMLAERDLIFSSDLSPELDRARRQFALIKQRPVRVGEFFAGLNPGSHAALSPTGHFLRKCAKYVEWIAGLLNLFIN